MVAASSVGERHERIAMGKLVRVGGLAILAAVVANVIFNRIAVALLSPPDTFLPLTVGPTIFFTAIGVLGAVIVFALLARFTQRPIRIFRIVALAVLLLSFIPDFFLLNNPAFPGATVPLIIVLLLEHVVAAAVAVWMLTTLTTKS